MENKNNNPSEITPMYASTGGWWSNSSDTTGLGDSQSLDLDSLIYIYIYIYIYVGVYVWHAYGILCASSHWFVSQGLDPTEEGFTWEMYEQRYVLFRFWLFCSWFSGDTTKVNFLWKCLPLIRHALSWNINLTLQT